MQRQVDAVAAMMAEQQPPAQPEGGAPPPAGSEPPAPEGDEPPAGGEPAGGEEPPVGDDTWEQRARSMAGRLDQALNANSQLSARISELETQVSTQRLYAKGGPAPAPAAPAPVHLIKDEERTDYGEEFFDVVGRRAQELIMPEMRAFDERMKRLESGQQGVVEVFQRTQKRDLYSVLREAVPDWKAINHHPDFAVWLSYPDPYSGMKRHDLLNDAFARHDANRVVNFFTGFLSDASAPPQSPQGGNPPAPPLPNGQASGNGSGPAAPPLPGNGQASGQPTLEALAAPGRARPGPQTLPPDKPIYTQASIAKFSDDERRGLWRGREVEAAGIWRDIFQAQHEGRIQ